MKQMTKKQRAERQARALKKARAKRAYLSISKGTARRIKKTIHDSLQRSIEGPDIAPEAIGAELDRMAQKAHEIITGFKKDLPAQPCAQDFLEQAAYGIVAQGRVRDQPGGERSMARTVEAFNVLTGNLISERDGWLFMAVLNAARATAGAHSPGDYQKGSAYFALAGECAARKEASKKGGFNED